MSYKNPIPKLEVLNNKVSESDGAYIGKCEFCGKENLVVTGTAATAPYCKDCLNNAIIECKAAIQRIREYVKTNKLPKVKSRPKITEEELTRLERQKDKALAELMQGKIY